jgi:hypothetical protein
MEEGSEGAQRREMNGKTSADDSNWIGVNTAKAAGWGFQVQRMRVGGGVEDTQNYYVSRSFLSSSRAQTSTAPMQTSGS